MNSIVLESGVFEGQADSVLFNHSTRLLSSGTYQLTGVHLGVSLTHGGPGLQALALPVYNYWMEQPVTDDVLCHGRSFPIVS